jgi:hypothetical protein
MFHYRRWLFLAVSALWLLSGASLSYAQKDGDDKTRAQAIESVKKNLARDPKNQGLQHALQCLETNQCNDQKKLNQAMSSVKDNLAHHPEDQGMHHAMNHLEQHHQDLAHGHMGSGQPTPGGNSPAGGGVPHAPGPSDRPHR